jgi:hypothetical protein
MALPKRATNVKAKAVRERAYNKAQRTKADNKADQATREAVNRQRGYTGKQLDTAARKYAKMNGVTYRELRPFMKNLSTEVDIASTFGLI